MDSTPNSIDVTARPVDDSIPMDRRGWREMALETALLIPNLTKLLIRLLRDPRVSFRRKALVAAVLLYVVSPIDLIPDFIVGFGKLDDIVLLSVAIDHLMTGSDQAIIEEHWDGSVDALDLVRSVFRWGSEVVPGARK
ncbi:MAG: YkvA family protein [Actinomycetia bacterium]|nr:YkvA family protein [Actinomycetes bacterium]